MKGIWAKREVINTCLLCKLQKKRKQNCAG